jgi:N12 class adenine-specific DNA methylase
MTILKPLCLQGRRLSLVAFCLLSVRPLLSAQTGNELIGDACHNEVHQRDEKALWASRVQRRIADHVYLEEEIETVEGPIHRLISVDGHEPSPSERKQDDARLHDLARSPKTRLALKKDRDADERKVDGKGRLSSKFSIRAQDV